MRKHGSFRTVGILAFLSIFVFIGNTAFAGCPSADLTGDCFVDLEDFAVMAKQWLTGEPNIPEDMRYIPDGGFEMGRHVVLYEHLRDNQPAVL
jgi:hypothetical protein